ncbi:hypothetical protein [Chryseobacterium sp. SIMBA_038]|uniref:hypothetical protein n=1 Tax=Chryseobacterium sp. SIMBA_038 TaxID=3085780 RepID=UPI003979EE7A
MSFGNIIIIMNRAQSHRLCAADANLTSGTMTISRTWLINDVKATSERGFLDRTGNKISPIGSAIINNPDLNHLIKNISKGVGHRSQFN